MPAPSTGASEFILIPSDTYNRLQRQPSDEPATTIERQAVLTSNHIPESVKTKIISTIDRNIINELGEPPAAVVAAPVGEPSTSETKDDSTAMETSVLETETDADKLDVRERIFKTLDIQMPSATRVARARQTFDLIAAHKRVSIEPHTHSFVVDGSTFNTIDVVAFLSDMQVYGRKLPESYIRLVQMVKIPVDLLLNKYAKQAVEGKTVGDHISTSTPRAQPTVRRGGRRLSLRPTSTADQFSPIQRPAWVTGLEEEEEEVGVAPLTEQDVEQVFHTPNTSPRRPADDGYDVLEQGGYTYTF
jgi:hypothetical protein